MILQVAEVLFGLLGLPDLDGKLVVRLARCSGFPLGADLLLGLRADTGGPEARARGRAQRLHHAETGRKLDLIVVGLLVIAIVVVAVERFIPRTAPIPAATDAASGASPAEAPVQAAAKSIAVLPFADMSAGKDQEYFADGLSEELLNLLAKMPELRVIGRTSSFQFKGRERRPAGDRREAQRRAHPGGQRAQVRQQGAHHRAADQGRGRLPPLVGDLRPHARRHLRRAGRHCRRGGQGAEAAPCSARRP